MVVMDIIGFILVKYNQRKCMYNGRKGQWDESK